MNLEVCKFLPKCPVCLCCCSDNLTICINGHFICSQCYDKLNTTIGQPCPLCREVMIPTPIKNIWCMEFIDSLKQDILNNCPFKVGAKVDFLHENVWRQGTIKDLQLDRQSFEMDCDEYTKETIYIPLCEINRFQPPFSMTKNWRNLEYLSNIKNVQICLCCEFYDYSDSSHENCSDDFFCTNDKVWVDAQIVYICNASKYLLCVFFHQNITFGLSSSNESRDANSVWLPINSKKLRLKID